MNIPREFVCSLPLLYLNTQPLIITGEKQLLLCSTATYYLLLMLPARAFSFSLSPSSFKRLPSPGHFFSPGLEKTTINAAQRLSQNPVASPAALYTTVPSLMVAFFWITTIPDLM